ncbi:hypothetical protein BATDEDRAFT_28819 [Batrachochytrium dendrobatidis JAM81]|uniref:Uncharacterized protein n=1 Tax=Batrachochytrium dendrobatidis (strain JAM81 / FGSC 10211) TaxID=684364 RepID=F4PF89_BATDJ|nr:uncharacterized protein BATDEDRAFT_28819 [Batrachochytrium dendrobatidis JAM81]EGF76102.1 hypothetical protein BATDEDRAFT_28819 [Batrachochytrium dendrobatidis JAM81]|eukprot:XP_006683273.1 hypothetical protein BATDEDRAFT_28819 [Batrachochytrium dendrobatidis JAM81]
MTPTLVGGDDPPLTGHGFDIREIFGSSGGVPGLPLGFSLFVGLVGTQSEGLRALPSEMIKRSRSEGGKKYRVRASKKKLVPHQLWAWWADYLPAHVSLLCHRDLEGILNGIDRDCNSEDYFKDIQRVLTTRFAYSNSNPVDQGVVFTLNMGEGPSPALNSFATYSFEYRDESVVVPVGDLQAFPLQLDPVSILIHLFTKSLGGLRAIRGDPSGQDPELKLPPRLRDP